MTTRAQKVRLGVFMLLAVLIPGLGHTANGSTRWLRIGGLSIQAAEPARLTARVRFTR